MHDRPLCKVLLCAVHRGKPIYAQVKALLANTAHNRTFGDHCCVTQVLSADHPEVDKVQHRAAQPVRAAQHSAVQHIAKQCRALPLLLQAIWLFDCDHKVHTDGQYAHSVLPDAMAQLLQFPLAAIARP